jgi:hypothetical protein
MEEKRKQQQAQQFAKEDDQLNCTFQPNQLATSTRNNTTKKHKQQRHTHNNNNNNNRDDHDEDDEYASSNQKRAKEQAFYAFLNRQEGEERARREELTYEQQRLDYVAKHLTHKICPNCSAKQSFDEVKEKRKLCPGCNIPYLSPLTWNTVSKQFFHKMKTMEQKKLQKLQKIEQEMYSEIDQYTKNTKPKMTTMEQELFLQRLQEMMLKREQHLQTLTETVYQEKCTFQPQLKIYEIENAKNKNKKKKNQFHDEEELEEDDNESVLSKDPVRDFLLRYEEDLIHRKKAFPQKYSSPKRREDHDHDQTHSKHKSFKTDEYEEESDEEHDYNNSRRYQNSSHHNHPLPYQSINSNHSQQHQRSNNHFPSKENSYRF